MLIQVLQSLTFSQVALLIACLILAFAFEFVNGFHDTANAVATVIYTRSLRPTRAVVWSGVWNMIGIFAGGIGVAFAIVHLLPVESLIQINTNGGLLMVLSLLLAALLWNLGTWYIGLPSSSSHALIGAILGVGMASSYIAGRGIFQGLNTGKVLEVSTSLLLSPLFGFGLSALLLKFLKRTPGHKVLNTAATPCEKPPWWVRLVLIGTCTGVSFAHGSNDGQKGMGLIMLILIGIAPSYFALNMENKAQLNETLEAISQLDQFLNHAYADEEGDEQGIRLVANESRGAWSDTHHLIGKAELMLRGKRTFEEIPVESRWNVRQTLLALNVKLKQLEKLNSDEILPSERAELQSLRSRIVKAVEYVPRWVIIAVALSLGLGTMIGWKRVVITVGEKIGKSHLTYGQGASAELVAMTTIGIADAAGLPVSTTHVLSSGVAGTMWANRSGVNVRTVRSIFAAWVFTLPVSASLSAGLYLLGHWMMSGT